MLRVELKFSRFLLLPLCLLVLVACAASETSMCKETGRVCPPGTKCVAKGQACAALSCGNGVREPHEQCDDGANDDEDGKEDDRCSADCLSDQKCGNGIVDSRIGEQCDPPEPGKCSLDCKSDLSCGNGIWDKLETAEQCDGLDTPPGTVCLDCRVISCGNGRVDGDEECDFAVPGETRCTILCRRPGCGDGVVTPSEGEACDPKNDATCRADCKGKVGCGDEELSGDEECDDGNLEPGDGCGPTCLVERCGNGFRDPGEVCDGKNDNGGPCREDCRSDLTCGNGEKDPDEVCDYADPVNGTRCNEECSRLDGCGNGFVEEGEQCDPGVDASDASSRNVFDCDSDCTFPVCGDGHVNRAAGEECDPGTLGVTETCTSTCERSRCGDLFINAKALEECDDGLEDGVRCNGASAGARSCKRAECGDGYRNEAASEECEPAEDPQTFNPETGDSSSCNGPRSPLSLQCKRAYCGDLYRNAEAGELCDGGDQDTAGCNNGPAASAAGVACLKPICGDGYLNAAAGEVCEPNSAANADGDTALCNGPKAGVNACFGAVCGDGYANKAAGECGDSVEDTPACNGSKAGAPNGCRPRVCGDGYKHVDEECDSGGIDTAGCNGGSCTTPECGDGYVNRAAGELCDPGETPELVDDNGDSPTCNGKRAGIFACQPAQCGDGYRNSAAGECGDQSTDSGSCNSNRAGISVGCRQPSCGDGHHNSAAGEQCDTGGADTAECNGGTCERPDCGDGYLNPEVETCEPGDTGEPVNSDGDSALCNGRNAGLMGCQVPRCGDGYANKAALTGSDTNGDPALEACDRGDDDSRSCNGSEGNASKCQVPKCNDARVNRAFGEECDTHPNSELSDWTLLPLESSLPNRGECNAVDAGAELACKRARCGDSYTNKTSEECDPENPDDPNRAICNPSSAKAGACKIGVCGDGVVSGLEECDPGEDGVFGGADSVRCNGQNAAIKGLECTDRRCGDGYVNTASAGAVVAEECDEDSDECTTECTVSKCGDGIVHERAGEECDVRAEGGWPRYCLPLGRDIPSSLACKDSICGDGYLDTRFEACEDIRGDFKFHCPEDCPITP